MKLAASDFALWFIGVLGRESPIMGTLLPQKLQANRRALGAHPGTPSACVYNRQSHSLTVLVQWRIQDLQTARPRSNRGAEWPSAAGASIEVPRRVEFGEGCPPPQWEKGSGEGALPENFSILSLKMATFSAFWALFLQFIVHSSIDCLKRFRRQTPLLVVKLAVVCMQLALGDKISMLETTL